MSKKPTIADNISSLLDEAMDMIKPVEPKDIQHNHDERHIWDIPQQDDKPIKEKTKMLIARGNWVKACIPIICEWTPGKTDVVSGEAWYEVYEVYENGLRLYDADTNNYYIIKMDSVVEFSIGEKPCPLCDGEHQNAICQLP